MKKHTPADYEWFVSKFCDRCIHDQYDPPDEFGDCAVHTSFISGEAVKEWICDDDGKNPRCINFEGLSEADDAIHRQTPLFPYFEVANV